MPSQALNSLASAMPEVKTLAKSTLRERRRTKEEALEVARVVGRAQVMLLSSHFERYIYAANEEAVVHLNNVRRPSQNLPEVLRLLHSAQFVDEISGAQWDNRGSGLKRFVAQEAWLWHDNGVGDLVHDRLLTWMKTPKSKNIIRYYKYWGINDIFSSVTRSVINRTRLYLLVQEFVDKRNNIAHGDYDAQATRSDIARYLDSVWLFCSRADRILGKQVGRIAGGPLPW